MPVTMPVEPMVAVAGALLAQVPAGMEADKGIVAPAQSADGPVMDGSGLTTIAGEPVMVALHRVTGLVAMTV
jgi:hypothetical protein